MTQTFSIGDLIRCRPGHPDQRIHEVVGVTSYPAREPQPKAVGYVADPGCDAYTIISAVPISAYPEHSKHMTAEGYVPVTEMTDAQQRHLGAKLALRASAA